MADDMRTYAIVAEPTDVPFVWRSILEQTELALARKRRMRLIHKWRNGLARTHNPANGDRGKLARISAHKAMQLDRYVEAVLAPKWRKLGEEIAAQLMGGSDGR